LSGIDGPFTPDWLENSDGLAGCSDSAKESLLRVDISVLYDEDDDDESLEF